jgi:hypothetical protein
LSMIPPFRHFGAERYVFEMILFTCASPLALSDMLRILALILHISQTHNNSSKGTG